MIVEHATSIVKPGRDVRVLEFRQGPLYPAWRPLIAPHFAPSPEIRRYESPPTD